MDEFLIFVLVALVAFIGGVMAVASTTDSLWEKDCKMLGTHRSDDKVYVCTVKP